MKTVATITAREEEFKPERGDLVILKKQYARPGQQIVVLFHQSHATDKFRFSGTVLNTTETWDVGQYSDAWAFESFEPFSGEISLESD